MSGKSKLKWLYIIIALILTQGLVFVGRNDSTFVESWYSNGINLPIRQFLSNVTGSMPFSFGEVFLLGGVLILPLLFIFAITKAFRDQEAFKSVARVLLNTLVTIVTIYCLFIWLWGLNYYRETVYDRYTYDDYGYTTGELISFTEFIVNETIDLRREIPEKEIVWDEDELFQLLNDEMEKLSVVYPELQGSYGPAKPIFFSKQMMYTGIVGVYFPFTGEANVNVYEMDVMLPYTALHEMSHQRGIAHEDACNYYAYLLGRESEDIRVRYSASLSIMIRSMNTLYKSDRQAYDQLKALYSSRIKVDLESYNAHWEPFKGEVEERATKLNDTYLKSNGQESGVTSYNEVINLLIHWYKDESINKYQ